MKSRRNKAISNIVAAVLLISILIIVFSILYLYASRYISTMPSKSEVSGSLLVITGIHVGPGYIVIDVRAISPVVIKNVYFFSYPDNRLIMIIPVGDIYVVPGQIKHINVSLSGIDISSLPRYIKIGIGTARGGAPVIYGVPIQLGQIEQSLSKSTT